ncbi:hypothetical protein HW555_011882, partial [Spodoptera exigua]
CTLPVPTPVPAVASVGISNPVVTPDTIVFRRRMAGADDEPATRTSSSRTMLPLDLETNTSQIHYMDSLCKDHFLQRQYRKVDGGVLWSRNERNLDCTVTFQTHSILQRFMLHFDLLQLDCNDHLYVYDGAHATAPPKVGRPVVSQHQAASRRIVHRSNFVTLKYVTDNWGTDANGFRLVITAVKDPKHGCKEFRCKQREFCVSADLTCDGVDHCADGSDEDTATLCPVMAAAVARAQKRARRDCRETRSSLRARAGRRGRAACGGRPECRAAQGRVVRLAARGPQGGARPPPASSVTQCKFIDMTLNIFGLWLVCYWVVLPTRILILCLYTRCPVKHIPQIFITPCRKRITDSRVAGILSERAI